MAAIALVADGDDVLATQYDAIANELNGPWSSYTPDLFSSGGSPVLGSGSTCTGRYKEVADGFVHATGLIIFGSGMSGGSGDWQVHLPVSANFGGTGAGDWQIGSAGLRNAGTQTWASLCLLSSSSRFYLMPTNTGSDAFADLNTPFAWAAGDSFRFSVTYEPA